MNTPFSESFKALEKALDAIETAKHDLNGGFTLATTNRTYYAIFYCITALLTVKKIYPKTHQGMRAKFNDIFIRESIFPLITTRYVQVAFDLRQQADYDLDAIITKEEAQSLIQNANEFYEQTKSWIEDQFDASE